VREHENYECKTVSESDCSPIGLATGIMPTYNTWNFCTSSVFGVGNSAKGNTQITHYQTPII